MDTARDIFRKRLASVLRIWRAGLLVDAALRTAGIMLLVVLAYGVADYFLALESAPRVVLSLVTLAVLAGLAGTALVRVVRLSEADAARRADEVLGGGRRAVQSAWEIGQDGGGETATGLNAFLRERQLQGACGTADAALARGVWPAAEVRRSRNRLLVKAGGAAVLVAFNFWAALVIAGRLAAPWVDIPPYSAFAFQLEPAHPQVVYGDSLEVKATIDGAPVTEPVYLLTRRGGKVRRLACYQVSANQFVQRLEHVTEPVEFCVATGRARSCWQRVDVRLLPRISMAGVTVYPPAYARQPNRQFLLGRDRLEALVASRVRLTVTSNRPLKDGELTLTPKDPNAAGPEVIAGRPLGPHTLAFEWVVRQDADAAVAIRDTLGTPNDTPFVFAQHAVPDAPPEVKITSPKPLVLATPDGTIPLRGTVRDDMALKRAELVRTRQGYRDRGRELDVPAGAAQATLAETVDLAALGAEAGDTLELYLEAADFNPTLLGVAMSEPVRVVVITREEYARRLREAATLEKFVARYQVLALRLKEQRKAAAALRAAAENPATKPEDLAKGLEDLRKQNAANEQLFSRLAKDFEVFAMDASLKETAGKVAESLAADGRKLKAADASKPQELARTLGEVDGSLNASGEAMARQQADAEEVARIGQIMRQSARFMELLESERALARQAERFTTGTQADYRSGLEGIAARQRAIREGFDQMLHDLTTAARELGPAHRKVAGQALGFAEAARDLRISAFMERAQTSAQAADGEGTGLETRTVVAKMEQLLKEQDAQGNCVAGMCRGKLGFKPRPALEATLEQLLANLLGKGGSGGGSGSGPGGPTASGYWARGNSLLAVPVYGPQRLELGESAGVIASESPDAAAAPVTMSPDATATLDVAREEGEGSERLAPEAIPAKYREAVKRYFSPESATPAAPPESRP